MDGGEPMRVAVWEPELRTCGPVTWAGFVVEGLRRLGHEADLVTSTGNGRERAAWNRVDTARDGFKVTTVKSDVLVRDRDLVELLRGYDLVILTEPRNAPDEREAKKADDGRRPRYIEVLDQLQGPWTTYLHGNYYEDSRSPWLAELLGLSTFSGTVVTPELTYAGDVISGAAKLIVNPCLPYVPRSRPDSPVPSGDRIGMLGRVVTNKGQQLLLHPHVLEAVPSGWEVELAGPSVIMRSPTMSYLLFKLLETWGDGRLLVPDWMTEKPEEWQVFRGIPWERTDGRITVRYRGAYPDAIAEHWRHKVYVNLTSKTFSTGLIEYSGLEALDAGCMPVVPANRATAAPYRARRLTIFEEPPGLRGGQAAGEPVTLRDVAPEVVAELGSALDEACGMSDMFRADVAYHNREVLLQHHAPELVASDLIDAGGL